MNRKSDYSIIFNEIEEQLRSFNIEEDLAETMIEVQRLRDIVRDGNETRASNLHQNINPFVKIIIMYSIALTSVELHMVPTEPVISLP